MKAGPDNATVYMTGMGIMYKEHEILVEVNNDGSGVICESPLAANADQLHPETSTACAIVPDSCKGVQCKQWRMLSHACCTAHLKS